MCIIMARVDLSFVIPCLNEEATIGSVIRDCHEGGRQCQCPYEIIVADNGSRDSSREIAARHGARVIRVHRKGYGSALIEGIKQSGGHYIIMADGDRTYDFTTAARFYSVLLEGKELVVGNRFDGGIEKGAMPFLHYYVGNPILSFLGRIFFDITLKDFHCGMRGFKKSRIIDLGLSCNGMEFASEMIIRASLENLDIGEIPTKLRCSAPGRVPHLKTWRDGWRHLKFMLSFAPRYNLLPLACIALLGSILLWYVYQIQLVPFTGKNTLIAATSFFVLSVNILCDYVLTREMIMLRFRGIRRSSRYYDFIRMSLGLTKGTDRLFKLSAISLASALLGFICLIMAALLGDLSSYYTGSIAFSAFSLLILSLMFYQTASKVTSIRTLFG